MPTKKFFHIIVTNKMSNNKIVYFKDTNINQIDDPSKKLEHTQTYFQDAFTTSHEITNSKTIKSNPCCFNNADLSTLDKPLTTTEISQAIFSFKPLKSPEPYGFNPFFFQKYWHLIGSSVTTLCHQIFEICSLPSGINNTFLCLIPRVPNGKNLKNIRPIGLCNTIYKLSQKLFPIGLSLSQITSLLLINPTSLRVGELVTMPLSFKCLRFKNKQGQKPTWY